MSAWIAWTLGGMLLLALGVLIEERTGLLQVGTPAPDFTATLSTGEPFTLAEYRGNKTVVLFFYPGDFTAGCTEQACAFRDSYAELRDAGAMLVGVSQDTDSSHMRFAEEYRLPYPLISDRHGMISRAYGVLRFGGLIRLPKRVTYVIDPQGVVQAAIHHEIGMNRHVRDVRRALARMKAG